MPIKIATFISIEARKLILTCLRTSSMAILWIPSVCGEGRKINYRCQKALIFPDESHKIKKIKLKYEIIQLFAVTSFSHHESRWNFYLNKHWQFDFLYCIVSLTSVYRNGVYKRHSKSIRSAHRRLKLCIRTPVLIFQNGIAL